MEKERANEDYSEEIALLAYTYWENRGREDGHDVEDWVLAEQEVQRRHARPAEEQRRQTRAAA